jgi:hypothetical protein
MTTCCRLCERLNQRKRPLDPTFVMAGGIRFPLPFLSNTRLFIVLIGTAKRDTENDRKATQLRHFNRRREPSQNLWPVSDGVLLLTAKP